MIPVLLDTNILIDFYEKREPFYQDAMRLVIARTFGDVELWVSAKSFTDVFYVLRKRYGSAVIQQAFCESFADLNVCSIDGADIMTASQRAWPDFEDCLVAIAAEKVKAEVLITRDTTGFTQSRVSVMTPAEFFDWLASAHGITYEDVSS